MKCLFFLIVFNSEAKNTLGSVSWVFFLNLVATELELVLNDLSFLERNIFKIFNKVDISWFNLKTIDILLKKKIDEMVFKY